MKNNLLIALLVMSSSLFAAKGPMPHERMAFKSEYYAKDELTGKYVKKIADKANATDGTYLYLGEVPKFKAEELEITVSKMALTNRVTGWVSQALIDAYASELYLRWKTVDDAVKDPNFSFHPLMKLSSLVPKNSRNTEAWTKIAEQYTTHNLESTGVDIYGQKRNTKNFESSEAREMYKEMISETYFKFLFNAGSPAEVYLNNNQMRDALISPENSRKLFNRHMSSHFTQDLSKAGYLGFVTFVYPIAATVEGPFGTKEKPAEPYEGVYGMLTEGSMEARLWSDKWDDEFAGFPFLLIESSGVAFHGPITAYNPLDVWFLRRGYVSHGCHRMDSADVLELRMLMPSDFVKANGKIKATILNYFDVADVDRDGKLEAIDVKYYNIPMSISVTKKQTVEGVIKPYLVENQQQTYFNDNAYASKYYRKATDTLKDVPKYQFSKNKVSKVGVHAELPIKRFEYRNNRIIQYKEEGIKFISFDGIKGNWHPKKFQQH
jgi:hypothetical protein